MCAFDFFLFIISQFVLFCFSVFAFHLFAKCIRIFYQLPPHDMQVWQALKQTTTDDDDSYEGSAVQLKVTAMQIMNIIVFLALATLQTACAIN